MNPDATQSPAPAPDEKRPWRDFTGRGGSPPASVPANRVRCNLSSHERSTNVFVAWPLPDAPASRAFQRARRRVLHKYRNPITVAPAAPPAVLARAVLAKTISAEHARKLATRLGRKSYGEIGLTSGVVDGLLDEVLGFGALDWTVKMQLSHDLAA
jgi:hypothetical protein